MVIFFKNINRTYGLKIFLRFHVQPTLTTGICGVVVLWALFAVGVSYFLASDLKCLANLLPSQFSVASVYDISNSYMPLSET